MISRLTPLAIALALSGCEHFACHGVKDHADNRLFVFHQCNRDSETRITVGEIRRAVERVHVPAVARARGAFGEMLVSAALFADDGVRRKMSAQAADHAFFRAAVGLRDEVHFAFIGDGRRMVEFGKQNGASFASDFGGDVKVFTHRGHSIRIKCSPPL